MARRLKLALLALAVSLVAAGAVPAGPGTVLVEQPVRTSPRNDLAPAAAFNPAGVDNLV